jgi:hypothetical protein
MLGGGWQVAWAACFLVGDGLLDSKSVLSWQGSLSFLSSLAVGAYADRDFSGIVTISAITIGFACGFCSAAVPMKSFELFDDDSVSCVQRLEFDKKIVNLFVPHMCSY